MRRRFASPHPFAFRSMRSCGHVRAQHRCVPCPHDQNPANPQGLSFLRLSTFDSQPLHHHFVTSLRHQSCSVPHLSTPTAPIPHTPRRPCPHSHLPTVPSVYSPRPPGQLSKQSTYFVPAPITYCLPTFLSLQSITPATCSCFSQVQRQQSRRR